MGARVFDDDRPTVDLGPRTSELDTTPEATTEDLGEDDPPTEHAPPAVDAVHGLPTQQLASGKPRSGTLTRLSDSRTTSSPVEAMRQDEIARTRVFTKVSLCICVGGALIALSTTGDPIAQSVVVAGSVLSALAAIWIGWLTRDPARYEPRKMALPGIAIIFGAMSGVYYWGAASPVAAMLVYGIYFFSLGSDRVITALMYAVVSAIHAVLAIGIISGMLVDRGLIKMTALRWQDQLAIVVIVELLYFIAFLTARLSQRATLHAMSRLEQAVRGMAQRDALLAEARAELERALKIGGPGRYTEQVVGSYRLGVLIGRGGMGEVYEAHHVADRREAAVKLLHPGTLAEPVHVQRFIREAETTARLDCANIVRVLEVGTTTGQVPFLAMERLRGNDLAHQLRRQRRLQLPATRALVEQVALGLEAARQAGIVHRDLKPHNVFLAEEGGVRRWKILDFGVSKAGSSGTLTKGHVVGTPAYMAPEQARGEEVDHRADVYSLAAILYRTITGHPAFTGKDVPTTLYEVVYRIPTQPSMLTPLPADVDRVLALGLAKSAKDRFETAMELARWFVAAIDSALTPEQRRHADELIAKAPWGTRPGVTNVQ